MDLSLYEELAIVNRERLYMYLEHASTSLRIVRHARE